MTVLPLIEKLLGDQEQRHAWLFETGEKIRRWKEEELAALSGSHPSDRASSCLVGSRFDPGRKEEERDNG